MIKATELRIGNLMFDFVSGAYLRVVGIAEGTTDYYVIDRDKYPLQNVWFAQPIPISEDILLKCGFSSDQWLMSFHLGENKMWVDKAKRHFFWVFGHKEVKYKRIDHLHQLQNLFFALTGEELNVNL